MTHGKESENRKLQEAVRLREAREAQWKRSGERPLWRNMSMIGALGWLVVIPLLLGAFVGRWLDTQLHTGIFWSGALIMLGATLGGWLAWRRINSE